MRELERIVEEEGFEARAMTWEQLGFEAGLNVSGRTIQRAMGTISYHKCIACRKGWVSPSTAKARKQWCEDMLAAHPNVEDWHKYYGYEPVEDNIISTCFTDRPSRCLTSATTCLGLDPE
jgi:hypothetical protein